MWWYATSCHIDGEGFEGACFVDAPSLSVAQLHAIRLGAIASKIVPLPYLEDQIPQHYLGRFLGAGDLQQIDIILDGDGTGTIPAEARWI